MQKKICMYGLLSAFLCCGTALAQQQQHTVEMIPFGDMDQWIDRQIKESGIIGGALKNVYAIGPTATIRENKAYKNMGGSPWATSNVMARVAGITKTNTSVFPEKRGDGYCARMDTRMESVKVLGIVDITVLAAGSMFLGEVHEPIKGTKNPQKMLNSGIPFTKKPIAVQFDYKVNMSDREKRIRATGFSRITDVEGKDFPEVNLFLQKRWEEGEGEVHAVVALDIHAMEPQPLGAHGCQREEEARQRQLLVPPPSGGPKQKEQWREEQAIAGIAAQCKNAVVKGPKQRDLGNQSIVTVPAQTDEIE